MMPENTPAIANLADEDAALASGQDAFLPDGVTAIAVTHYRVGPYRYTSLGDALAQHRRQSV